MKRNVGVFLILLLLFQVQLYSKGKDKVILKAGHTIRITWKDSTVKPVVGQLIRIGEGKIVYSYKGKVMESPFSSVAEFAVKRSEHKNLKISETPSSGTGIVAGVLVGLLAVFFVATISKSNKTRSESRGVRLNLPSDNAVLGTLFLVIIGGIIGGALSYKKKGDWIEVPLDMVSMEEAQEKSVEGEKEEAPGIRVIMDQRSWGFFVEGYESEMFQDGFFRVESSQFRLPADLDMPFEEIMEPVLGPTFFLNSHLNRGNN